MKLSEYAKTIGAKLSPTILGDEEVLNKKKCSGSLFIGSAVVIEELQVSDPDGGIRNGVRKMGYWPFLVSRDKDGSLFIDAASY